VLAAPDVPANSIRELVSLDREKPDSLSYGTWGDGSPPQLLYETLTRASHQAARHSLQGSGAVHECVGYGRDSAVGSDAVVR